MSARIAGMCYGDKRAWSSRAAGTRSRTRRGRRRWQRELPVRPGRLPVCCNRCRSFHNHVARWRSRGGCGVGFRTPARAHPYHNGLASGFVREPNRRLNCDLDLLCPFLLRAYDHHRAVSVVNDGGGDASHQRPPDAAEAPAPHHNEPGA
jgi:hypothetical protein